jgi:prophage regulatory protein
MPLKDHPSTPPRVARMPEVTERTGLSRGSIYRLMSAGRFPRSIKLGERAIGWRESDLNAWLESRQHAA